MSVVQGNSVPFLERIRLYALQIRLDRPIGTLLLLWPTLWALWLSGQGRPEDFVDGQTVAANVNVGAPRPQRARGRCQP